MSWLTPTLFYSTQTVLAAHAEADAIRLRGKAEAISLEARGKAEAEQMRLRAEAYSHYSNAAMLSLILDALPRVAAEISAPLSKTQEIVLLGGVPGSDEAFSLGKLGKELCSLITNVPPAVRAVTGVDLSQVSSG
ncbi:unnamed protein product [Protopolystoma xenopodis]|uniref:Flotillin C-terminal domain-containing protein n=1 Tax=Protopolystoma xenopodis TaxID=117903 RepID=A0A3S5CD54_9PLAT|nr:unnamed protein product [Protopolystoma xenopodis]